MFWRTTFFPIHINTDSLLEIPSKRYATASWRHDISKCEYCIRNICLPLLQKLIDRDNLLSNLVSLEFDLYMPVPASHCHATFLLTLSTLPQANERNTRLRTAKDLLQQKISTKARWYLRGQSNSTLCSSRIHNPRSTATNFWREKSAFNNVFNPSHIASHIYIDSSLRILRCLLDEPQPIQKDLLGQ